MDFEQITNQIIEKKNTFNVDKAIQKLNVEIDIEPLLQTAENFSVTGEEQAKNALSMSLQSRKLKKALDESRKEIIKPHFDFQRAINKIVKDYTTKLEQIEENLKGKLDTWLKAQSTFNQDFSNLVIEVDDGNFKKIKKWVYTVEEAGVVPVEYLVIDDKAIKTAIKSGVRNIPGLKIFEEESISMRVKN